jgi:hypothetical protein
MPVVRIVRRRVGRMRKIRSVGAGKGSEVIVEAVVLLDDQDHVPDGTASRGFLDGRFNGHREPPVLCDIQFSSVSPVVLQ